MKLKKYITTMIILITTVICTACSDNEDVERIVIQNNLEFSMDNIQEIIVDCNNVNINVISKDIDAINVELYGSMLPNANKEEMIEAKIISTKSESDLILGVNTEVISSNDYDLTLNISIPIEYDKNILINSSDSEVKVIGTSLNALELSGNKVDIDLEDIIVNFVRGTLNEVKADGNNVDTINVSLDITTGELDLRKFTGNVEVFSGICDISVDYRRIEENNISLITEEGDVEISLPTETGFYIDSRVHDGYIKSDFLLSSSEIPVEEGLIGQYKEGQNKITAKTNKGNIKIIKK